MGRCPSCASEISEAARDCPTCGADLQRLSATPTRVDARLGQEGAEAPGGQVRERAFARRDPPTSSSSIEDGQFFPGSLLAGRYRIVALLGRGGMGEVYRADDLKLAQPVSLKFLPESLAASPSSLARLHNEVRIARQVSHPNVCRVYDIGEAGHQSFLTMEYVDGEDLASLLRRIGRLPGDKAIQIARQMCAGLAAAHDKGVLHRDLKPSNVMIDGRGQVRITDFGLAGLAERFQGREIREGTPAYMAPEQAAGKEVTVRSDLYSLGLVLFELFTGRFAFEASTAEESARRRAESEPTRPSSLVANIDPVVERVLIRCLEKDPVRRPVSALSVAAALPGGDPLAAALAAGETPSPEMVAAAREEGGLRPAVGWTCLGAALLGLMAVAFLSDRVMLFRKVPLARPPEALAERAREIVQRVGYVDPPVDSAYGFGMYLSYLRYVAANDASAGRWNQPAGDSPTALFFWYRQSPHYLEPTGPPGAVEYDDPPEELSGMRRLSLDTEGRLWEFDAVPPQLDDSKGPWPDPDWPRLFTEAGLEVAKFAPLQPAWTPPVFADRRAAWEGPCPGRREFRVRVEAAAYHGSPVHFQIIWPWTKPLRMEPLQFRSATGRAGDTILMMLILTALAGGTVLARRNLRLGRGDRRGAFRLALFFFFGLVLVWVFWTRHVPLLTDEVFMLVPALGLALLMSGCTWLYYIALEPYVRRRWPGTIVSWTRLLSGKFRDALVGRDILIGVLFGIAAELLARVRALVPSWVGLPPPIPLLHPASMEILLGTRHVAIDWIVSLFVSVASALLLLFLLLILRVVLRRQWAAVAALCLIYAAVNILQGWQGVPWIDVTAGALIGVSIVVALVRFGLLAAMVSLFVSEILFVYPMTLDLSTWYAGGSLLVLLIAVALSALGFYLSLGGRPLLRDELLQG